MCERCVKRKYEWRGIERKENERMRGKRRNIRRVNKKKSRKMKEEEKIE